ncbi:MAG TPA: efflux RND transporter periplasmic adaptor subunit [Thermoanaerobaculia bacterium]|nr:efflux RND transporter periplasmic adaptor subunit [Thermoanaerobaculia bacterium]
MILRSRPALAVVLLAALLPAAAGGGREPAAGHDEHGPRDESHDEHEDGHSGDGHAEEGHEEGVVTLTPEAERRIGLETTPVERRPVEGAVGTTGTVGFDERRLAHLGPRLEGRLQRVEAELGERVRAGEVLAWIDSVALGAARAAWLRARAHHEVAETHWRRQRELHAQDIVSEQEILEARAEALEAAADLAAAADTLRLYGVGAAELESLRDEGRASPLLAIRAPFAGRVVAKEAVLGEMVAPDDTLFTVADLSTVWVWLDVYERELARVAEGDRVEVRFDAYPGETFRGRLGYLGSEIAAESRTARARVDLPNPDGRLRPGMFARVDLRSGAAPADAGEGGEALAVPEAAIQRQAGTSVVFVAVGDHRYQRRAVTLGRRGDGWVEVLSGVEPGERVVTRGVFLLQSQASEDQLGGGHHH